MSFYLDGELAPASMRGPWVLCGRKRELAQGVALERVHDDFEN